MCGARLPALAGLALALLPSRAVRGIESLVATMQMQWQRQEILANNLANLSTPGFKQDDLALVPDGAAAPGRDGTAANLLPQSRAMRQWTDWSQGFVRETGRNLDLALNGNGFFVVETPAGPRFTRAGVFTLSRDGFLATNTGERVLGDRGPIALGSERVTINTRGEIHRNGQRIGTLRVVDFPQPYRLRKEGNGLVAPADPTVLPEPARDYEVMSGALENSNVNPVETMVNMIDLLRKYEAAQKTIQAVQEANKQATTDIGRV